MSTWGSTQDFLDGRPLPTDPEPSFKGYCVGKWEGDTLVVETIGYKEDWLDSRGQPLTEQARTIERIRRVNYGNLEVGMTVDDPKAYTKPWKTQTIKLALALNTDLLEYICNENEKSLPHMVGAGDHEIGGKMRRSDNGLAVRSRPCDLGAGAPLVLRRVRPGKADHANGSRHEDRMDEPAYLLAPRRERRDGEGRQLGDELGNPTSLIRLGWTRTAMQVGNVVTVDGYLARDGSNLANARTVLWTARRCSQVPAEANSRWRLPRRCLPVRQRRRPIQGCASSTVCQASLSLA